jgi:hypothetical protein
MSFSARSASNAVNAPPAAPESMVHAQVCWNPMPPEAHCAIEATLEEKACLARLATAAIETHSAADMSGITHCA